MGLAFRVSDADTLAKYSKDAKVCTCFFQLHACTSTVAVLGVGGDGRPPSRGPSRGGLLSSAHFLTRSLSALLPHSPSNSCQRFDYLGGNDQHKAVHFRTRDDSGKATNLPPSSGLFGLQNDVQGIPKHANSPPHLYLLICQSTASGSKRHSQRHITHNEHPRVHQTSSALLRGVRNNNSTAKTRFLD